MLNSLNNSNINNNNFIAINKKKQIYSLIKIKIICFLTIPFKYYGKALYPIDVSVFVVLCFNFYAIILQVILNIPVFQP